MPKRALRRRQIQNTFSHGETVGTWDFTPSFGNSTGFIAETMSRPTSLWLDRSSYLFSFYPNLPRGSKLILCSGTVCNPWRLATVKASLRSRRSEVLPAGGLGNSMSRRPFEWTGCSTCSVGWTLQLHKNENL